MNLPHTASIAAPAAPPSMDMIFRRLIVINHRNWPYWFSTKLGSNPSYPANNLRFWLVDASYHLYKQYLATNDGQV